MSFNVNEIKSQLTYGGARPAQFYVQFSNPSDSSADLKVPFMVQAASLPASTLGQINVPYFGRTIPVPGDRTYSAWNVNVMNDEDFLVRNSIEKWSHDINSPEGNIRRFPGASALLTQGTALVTQMGKNGQALRTYKFHGIWPQEVGEIQLAWDATDQIELFPVTFAYDFWTVVPGPTGDGGGE